MANAADEADRLFDLAGELLSDIVSRDPEAAAVFNSWLPLLRRILNGRDALWNYRDVSSRTGDCLRSGVLFRGSSPTRYYNDPRFTGKDAFGLWLASAGVVQTIDLRMPVEVDASPYPASLAGRIARFHHPIEGKIVEGLGEGAPDDVRVYLGFFEAHHDAIRETVRRVAESSGATLIHCHAGMDRTGVVVAVLGWLCDVPRDELVTDYLASGGTTRAERIEALLDHLAGIGDAGAVAHHLGVGTELLSRLRARLLP